MEFTKSSAIRPGARWAGAALALGVALWATAFWTAPARAALIAGLQDRSVLAEADAFDAALSDGDSQEAGAPDDARFQASATAGAFVPDVAGNATASQDSRLDAGSAAVALSAEALGSATPDAEIAFGTFLSESFAEWIFQVDASGDYRLSGQLGAATDAVGDAFASVSFEELVLGGDPIPMADVSVSLAGSEMLDVALSLEAGSLYRLTAVALAVAQVDGFDAVGHGRATLEIALAALPEPGVGSLLAVAVGLGARVASRRRAAMGTTRA